MPKLAPKMLHGQTEECCQGFGFAHDEIAFRVVGGAFKILERVGLGVARVVLQTHPWFGRYDLMGQPGKWSGVLVLTRNSRERLESRADGLLLEKDRTRNSSRRGEGGLIYRL